VSIRVLIVSLFICASLLLIAAPPPNPAGGVIERQIEKEYEAQPLDTERKIPQIQIDVPKEQLSIPDGTKVFVGRIEIRGNDCILSRDICWELDSDIHQSQSISDIYKLCQKIEALYASRGYFLARVYPPPQEIKDDVLILEVLEGRLGKIRIVGNRHYSELFILRYFAPLQNKALNYNRFLRALMLLNENSDLEAGAVLEKGSRVGTADLIIRVQDKYPVHLYLNGNDYGRFLTTNFRAGGRLDTQLLRDGDKLSIAEVVGFPIDALYFTDVVYRFPCNAFGTFGELAYLTSRFHVEKIMYLRQAGRSDIATVKVSQAIQRGRFLSTDCFASFDYKQIKNYTLSHLTSFDRIRLLTLGSTVDYYSPKAGRNYLVVKMGFGLPGIFGGLSDPRPISSREGARGNFIKVNADYDFMKKLPYDSFLVAHASGQYSFNKLTVPEQIYIGGVDTIRGFPLASALGDSGYYCNFELRFPPPGLANSPIGRSQKKWKEFLQFSAFFDQGGVAYRGGGSTFECGTGLGVRINAFWKFALTAEVGFPLNHRDLSKDAFFYFKLTGQPF